MSRKTIDQNNQPFRHQYIKIIWVSTLWIWIKY